MSKQITIVSNSSGDWEALYVNGVKKAEGHTISTRELFEVLGIPIEFIEIQEPRDVDGEVDFAERLADVKFVPYEDEE